MELNADLRLLTAKLINLRDRYPTLTTSAILREISNRRGEPLRETARGAAPRLVFFSFWHLLFACAVALWWPFAVELYNNPYSFDNAWKATFSNSCLVENFMQELGRPTFDCSLCTNLTTVPVLRHVSRTAFYKQFAFSGVPVLVKGAAQKWPAVDTFTYDWLQKTYDDIKGSYEEHDLAGQFFPYKTEFKNLEDALHMSQERRNKSWYFGW